MFTKDLLHMLQLGSPVAESDDFLQQYFVETEVFRDLVEDRVDIVAGDKGSGKSAIYRILSETCATIPELHDVQVVSAFNPQGTPVFQRLAETRVLSENQYIQVWKTYFVALAGNWILEFVDGDYTPLMAELDTVLSGAGLRTCDNTPDGTFAHLVKGMAAALRLRSVETSAKIGPAEVTAKIELLDRITEPDAPAIQHDDALRLLNRVLDEMGVSFWLTLDRLDEAFQGRPELERNALRALFRTFLDMQEFSRLRLKIFVRRDLFARIISGGFVNLTHVNARLAEIHWDEDDLYSLLYKRVVRNGGLVEGLQLPALDPASVFSALFPAEIECRPRASVSRRPVRTTTPFQWMMRKIADGKGVRAPRNLIDLVKMARDSQLRKERREPREFGSDVPVIELDSLIQAFTQLSNRRVVDTLLAEAGEFAPVIEMFRGGRPEYEGTTLAHVLGGNYASTAQYLHQIGFLESLGAARWRVPPLYRAGLAICSA